MFFHHLPLSFSFRLFFPAPSFAASISFNRLPVPAPISAFHLLNPYAILIPDLISFPRGEVFLPHTVKLMITAPFIWMTPVTVPVKSSLFQIRLNQFKHIPDISRIINNN